jgi:hypothetical protein
VRKLLTVLTAMIEHETHWHYKNVDATTPAFKPGKTAAI